MRARLRPVREFDSGCGQPHNWLHVAPNSTVSRDTGNRRGHGRECAGSGEGACQGGAKASAKAAAAAKPPRPGLTSCAGKIEGRYAASNGLPYTMEFRSGKAKMTVPIMGTEEVDCWMGDGKIQLFMKGEPEPMIIDVNDDGTLQTPFGEMKKKGS